MVCLSGFYFLNNKAQSTNNAGRPRIVLHDNSVRTLFLAVASRTGSFDKKIPLEINSSLIHQTRVLRIV
jgi:hypothetical protein